MKKQNTLHNVMRASGVGIHTGQTINMTLRPAPPYTGIVFRRVDLTPAVNIPARANLVSDTTLSTKISAGGASVGTTEHLMAALAGLEVDNCLIELDGPEVPIMDGSAWSYVFMLRSAGIAAQEEPRSYIRITKPITVIQDGKKAELMPYDGFKASFKIDFNHEVLDQHPNEATVEVSPTTFIREIARARTFGFKKDIDMLRSMNLALGGSMDNAILVEDHGVANEDGLRSPDEFVKHKMLDAIGDLYLMGPILGEYRGVRSGHELNNTLAKVLMRQPDAWERVTVPA